MRGGISSRSGGYSGLHYTYEIIAYIFIFLGIQGGSMIKNLPDNVGDPDSVLGSERSPGEGNGDLLQYSCLEKSNGQRNLLGYV